MQLASITFDGEKKNSSRFIIPPSYFKKLGITPIAVNKPEKTVAEVLNRSEITEEEKEPVLETVAQIAEPSPKIIINKKVKPTSGLSLKSIRAKKEHEIRQMDVVVNEEDLPRKPFTQDDLLPLWDTFVERLLKEGKMNLASILSIDTPRLDGATIHLEFPNATNKVEVERQQFDLLQYLRKSLSNYDISLDIIVNEEMQKKFAYTPDEKYEKLKEKNPNIELLRKTFDLDI